MVTIERVICPIDLSVHSANALRVAASWARWYDAWLHVLHVAPLPQPILSPMGLLAALPVRPLPEITSEVEQFVADTLGPKHGALIDVVQGNTVGTIVHASTRPHALMVMGTHGWSGLDRVLLGSVAERVAHATHCPLLVVPPQPSPMASGATLKQILCAVDFRPSSLAGSRYALSLAQEARVRRRLTTTGGGRSRFYKGIWQPATSCTNRCRLPIVSQLSADCPSLLAFALVVYSQSPWHSRAIRAKNAYPVLTQSRLQP